MLYTMEWCVLYMYMWGVQGDLTNVNLGSSEPLCQLVTRSSSTDQLALCNFHVKSVGAGKASSAESWEIEISYHPSSATFLSVIVSTDKSSHKYNLNHLMEQLLVIWKIQ